jgi:hypothetical protein
MSSSSSSNGESSTSDDWSSRLQEVDVPSENSWVLKAPLGQVEVIKFLNCSRSNADESSPLLLQSFDFSIIQIAYQI